MSFEALSEPVQPVCDRLRQELSHCRRFGVDVGQDIGQKWLSWLDEAA